MKKGFTLIELLAVITILAVIALIAVPTILNVINFSKEGISNSQKDLILEAAKNYSVSNVDVDTNSGSSVSLDPSSVTIGTLKQKGYLDTKSSRFVCDDLRVYFSWQRNQIVCTLGDVAAECD